MAKKQKVEQLEMFPNEETQVQEPAVEFTPVNCDELKGFLYGKLIF
jgi:hypothetical protein